MNDTVILQPVGPGRPGFDPVRIVPEPGVGLLLIVGLAIVCLIRWRKQWRSRNVPVRLTDLYR